MMDEQGGATNDQLVVAQAHFPDAGMYSAVVSNSEGKVISAEAEMVVRSQQAGNVERWGARNRIDGWIGSVMVQPDGKIPVGVTTPSAQHSITVGYIINDPAIVVVSDLRQSRRLEIA